MEYGQHTRRSRTRSAESRQTTRILPDGAGNLLSHFRSILGADTMEQSTASLRFVQIGVLNFLLLTTASATGERATSASLTLAMPRGRWLQIGRYQRGLSKSPSPTITERLLESQRQQQLQRQYEQQYQQYKRNRQRPFWHYLTRG